MAKGKNFNMMQQVKVIQEGLANLQDELAEKTVESSVGGGMVVVVANGKQEILSVTIDQEVVDPDDVEMLQDLIVAAVNDAIKKSQDMVAQEMSKITDGLNIPGLKIPGLM